MNEYLEARNYLHMHYKDLMHLYSALYTQIEAEERNLEPVKLAAKTAYYTVVAHLNLSNYHILTLVESYIRNNKEKIFNTFERELTICILTESKLHDLEVSGLVKIERDKYGNTKFQLTTEGKTECDVKGITLEQLIDFYI
jgi:hypothetical protein